ncbi:hypothetical protein [Paenirhodobacter enshiensis]|uniref:hypothetical protein n=1 Tax=Paenirhodobacter enshiensis TaxID=1105367 RepID=UPI003FA34160
MKDAISAANDLLAGVGLWFQRKSEHAAAKREAKAWAKALPKAKLEEIVAAVPMPAHLWREDYWVLNQESLREGPAIYRAYVDENFSREPEARRVELVDRLMSVRYWQWSDATREMRKAAVSAGMAADQARRDAEYAARMTEEAARPHRLSMAGRKAEAEACYRNTGIYADGSGRVLSHAERFQLGLPANTGGAKSGLIDG